jgi:hypothetical protein
MTHFVVLRDDDTNGTTPVDQLERLYRPFLDRGMPVQLAVIPEVFGDARGIEGELEAFLSGPRRGTRGPIPLAENQELVRYLRDEPGYRVAQHGLHHDSVDGRPEFARGTVAECHRRIDRGLALLREAGLPTPTSFVAPQDQISRAAVRAILERFAVLSTGYYDLSRIPRRHAARYLWQKKVRKQRHFLLGGRTLLTHPGCILSYRRPVATMLRDLEDQFRRHPLTVVVSHHWEYFAGGEANQPMIDVLHALAERLARPDVRVIDFDNARAALG